MTDHQRRRHLLIHYPQAVEQVFGRCRVETGLDLGLVL